MSIHVSRANRAARCVGCALVSLSLLVFAGRSEAQEFARSRSVGGVSVDTNGVLENASIDALGKLRQMRAEALAPIPGQLGEAAALRSPRN